jgi:F-type H+-transporting ATPase subunit b
LRRFFRFALLFGSTAALCLAEGSEAAGDNLQVWKWANFLLLAAGLGYLIGKNAGPFFKTRSESIAKDITESERIRKDAEARAADVDRRLANLGVEIAALRTDSQKEAQSETERLAAHAAAEIAKIQAQATHEIESAQKAARLDLRRYAGDLAVELAEQKIRARMTPATQDSLVRAFVRDLK